MTFIIYTVLIITGLGLVYLFIVRPWHLTWGAFQEEVTMPLPGDDLVLKPDFDATRGITIASTPESIWKWIIQIGSLRAGWYSIDWMDNGGVKSSDKILAQWQKIEVGQFIPFTPDQKNGMWVKEYKEHEYILWVDKKGKATWLWYLYPIDKDHSRLLTRLRTEYEWKGFWVIYYLLYDFGDIVMMSKCMKGIKKRAERSN